MPARLIINQVGYQLDSKQTIIRISLNSRWRRGKRSSRQTSFPTLAMERRQMLKTWLNSLCQSSNHQIIIITTICKSRIIRAASNRFSNRMVGRRSHPSKIGACWRVAAWLVSNNLQLCHRQAAFTQAALIRMDKVCYRSIIMIEEISRSKVIHHRRGRAVAYSNRISNKLAGNQTILECSHPALQHASYLASSLSSIIVGEGKSRQVTSSNICKVYRICPLRLACNSS